METVLIRTRLIHAAESTMAFEGLMFDKSGQQLKTLIWITFTHVNLLTGRRAQHSAELMGLFQAILVDAKFYENEFNRRKEELFTQYRKRKTERQAR